MTLRRATQAALLSLTILLLFSSQMETSAQTGPVAIAYGRSWPRSMAVDPHRGVLYVDGLSGTYPPTGYSFGIVNVTSHMLQKTLPLNVTPGELALDPTNGYVYVAGSNSVAVFDPTRASFVRQYRVGVPVRDIAFDTGTGSLFLTSGNSVIKVDPKTGLVLGNATVGTDSEGIAIDPLAGRLYVANFLGNSVSIVSTSSLSLLGTVRLSPQDYPSQVLFDKESRSLYVTTQSNYVDVIDLQSNSLSGSITVAPSTSNSTFALALDEGTGSLFVLAQPGDTVSRVDLGSGQVVERYSLSSAAYEMVVNPVTHELYVSVYHDVVAISPGESPSLLTGTTLGVSAIAVAAALTILVVYILRREAGARVVPASARQGPRRSQPRHHWRAWAILRSMIPSDT